jgi:galactokinase
MKYFAPGRINLIGEHLDYNGGLVLPAALTIGITATYTPRTDNKVILRSSTHSFSKEFFAEDNLVYDSKYDWTNYPIGIIQQLKKEGHQIQGCEILLESNLPEGSGLSSSAAMEVLTAFMLLSQTETNIDLVWLANLCRQVENEFIGVKCGIMDQYSVALGRKDEALLLDCSHIHHQYIPIELEDYKLVIMDTKKPRKLIHSKYNERKHECEEALKQIHASKSEIKHLVEADINWIEVLNDAILKKRARHVISENLRVKETVKALRRNDLSTFGRLMNASHASLKNDYEATGIELDTLVEEAQKVKGCLGARMTGAGFGGCAIAIARNEAIAELKDRVSMKYFSVTALNCEIYESAIGEGVKKI